MHTASPHFFMTSQEALDLGGLCKPRPLVVVHYSSSLSLKQGLAIHQDPGIRATPSQ